VQRVDPTTTCPPEQPNDDQYLSIWGRITPGGRPQNLIEYDGQFGFLAPDVIPTVPARLSFFRQVDPKWFGFMSVDDVEWIVRRAVEGSVVALYRSRLPLSASEYRYDLVFLPLSVYGLEETAIRGADGADVVVTHGTEARRA